jgi:hypothetical protein
MFFMTFLYLGVRFWALGIREMLFRKKISKGDNICEFAIKEFIFIQLLDC